MKCPTCTDTHLAITSRHGIEIDLCPQCRGVWLDRGELDKIITRASRADDDDFDDDYEDRKARRTGYSSQRRKSWWTELFD